MRTALDAPPGELNEHETKVVGSIRDHGWFAHHIFAEGDLPGFSYTTGFWKSLGVPEMIVFSLKAERAHHIFWNYHDSLMRGQPALAIDQPVSGVFEGSHAFLLPVGKQYYAEHLGWSRWFYGTDTDFPCLQLVWPDKQNVFPWQPGFDDSLVKAQPILGARTGELNA